MGDHDPGAKAIVFSQFVNMLDLLEHRMRLSNMGCVKLVGNMNIDQRDMVINFGKTDFARIIMDTCVKL
jgi:SNF2 family DNA or RNA helicase